MHEQQQMLNLWEQAPMRTLLSWWQELDRARGDRAALRRCHTLAEIVLTPPFNRLRIDLSRFGRLDAGRIVRLAIVAGVLAHVMPPPDSSAIDGILARRMNGLIAQQMAAAPAESPRSPVSELRFRRFLTIPEDEHEKLYTAAIRLVRLLGGTWATVDAASLARGLYSWNQMTKQAWAFAYYDAAPATETNR